MIAFERFKEIISEDPSLAIPIRNATVSIPIRRSGPFGTSIDITIMFVIYFILKEIGLPWAYEAKRYSELWRLRFNKWIDEQYSKHEIDPEDARAFGESLRKELENISKQDDRKSWDRLLVLILSSNSEGE